MAKKQIFELETTLTFKGRFFIKAETEQQAREIVNDHCGLCRGGNIHTSWNDDDVNWHFDTHADKSIGKVCKKGTHPIGPRKCEFTSFTEFAQQILALAPYESVDFSTDPVEDCGWGARRMPLMDSDMLIVGMYGQGECYLHNFSVDGRCPEDVEEFLACSLQCHTTQGVWL